MVQPLPNQSLPVLKELACPSCGGPLPQRSPGTQTFICPKCNSYVNVGMDELKEAGKSAKLPTSPFPIRLGSRFTLEGVNYFVMGRVVYEGWDDEDRWQWTEWLLGSSDGRLIWLSHDNEKGFVLFRKMRIKTAFDANTVRQIPTSDNKTALVHERYPARIVGAEGELTFRASAGARLNMIEGAGHGKEYSIQVTASELEMYEGAKIDEMALATAFNNAEWIERVKRRGNRAGVYRLVAGVAFFFAVVAFVLTVVANGTGDLALSQVVTLNAATPGTLIPVNFPQNNRPAIVRLWLESPIPVNTFAEVEVSVISPDDTETFILEKEFWHETGIDEGERWTERDYFGGEVFVPAQVGQHEIEVALGENNTTQNFAVRVGVFQNHILPSYFLIYGVIAAALGILFIIMGARK